MRWGERKDLRCLSVQIMDMYTDNNFIRNPRTPGGAAGTWRLDLRVRGAKPVAVLLYDSQDPASRIHSVNGAAW
jgi:hypothetical protein